MDTSTNERSKILQKSYSVYCFVLKFVSKILYLSDVCPLPPKESRIPRQLANDRHGSPWFHQSFFWFLGGGRGKYPSNIVFLRQTLIENGIRYNFFAGFWTVHLWTCPYKRVTLWPKFFWTKIRNPPIFILNPLIYLPKIALCRAAKNITSMYLSIA